MTRKATLLFTVLLGSAQAQTITHRWSFNGTGASGNGTVLPDSITSANGAIVGVGAVRTGTALTLPGTTNGSLAPANISAYFDLPNGIVSSKTDMTVEIWATLQSSKNWQRLFDFGRMSITGNGAPGELTGSGGAPSAAASRDNLMLAAQRGTALNQQRIAARNDGATELGNNNSVDMVPGTRYHFVATFQAGVGANPATGGRFTWYRDGVQVGFVDTNFRLNQIEDVNNWLGRSQFTDDSNSNISYDEFRLYSGVMSPIDQTASRKAGVDAAMTPTANADTVSLMPGKKAGIPVLTNDSGQAFPSSVEIISAPVNGSASVQSDGRILYTHTNLAATSDSLSYRVRGGGGFSNTATVTITIQNALKLANSNLNVPAAPPTTALQLVNAFPLPNDDNGGLDFTSPVGITNAPGDTKRLFISQKGGLLQMVPDVTAATPTISTFLNLPTILATRNNPTESVDTGSECGLLGLAFHPNYQTNRRFFVFYSVTKGGQRYQRVSSFTAQANFNAADAASESILIEQLDQAGNHNGGDMHFGPDGYLYISIGDEGDGNDTFINSQQINKDFFSAILRIDVDKSPTNSIEPNPHLSIILDDNGIARYSVPKTNPFVLPSNGGNWNGTYNGSAVSGTVRSEFWATGLRNPWRMSFDPQTGTLWCGDVGQDKHEEINIITRGGNYGWVFREGNDVGARTTNPTMPANFDTLYHSKPTYTYDQPDTGSSMPAEFQGFSVTGGRVYRGTNIPSLSGKYIFGDYGTGNIWSMDLNGSNVTRIAGETGIAGFGYDSSNGDILIADNDGNRVLRLVQSTQTQSFPETLSATGLFADLTDLTPSPGMVPYNVNLPFWSDHAVKSRWFIVPNGTSQFTTSQDGLWTLPSGTIWVKHFDMEMQRGVPASKKRIETRLIVKNPTGAYGVSYRWNDAGTEADLVPDGGVNFNLAITENGNPVPQTWRIPSRAECMACHTSQAGHALSFNTRQLNLANSMLGFSGNQLTTLQQQGYFTNDPGSPNLLPRHLRPDETNYPLEARVRSYIAVNCSYCHKAGGSAPTAWDGRPELTLTATGLINGTPNNNGGNAANKLVVPGSTANSIVYQRVNGTGGFGRMPPLASNVIDQTDANLLSQWITTELPGRQVYADWRIANFEPDNDPSGAPAEDPDGDGLTNQEEFLAGTNPHDPASAFRPGVSVDGGSLNLNFSVPANRSYRIHTSTGLNQWTLWDIPENQGLPAGGGPVLITKPAGDPQRFFRIELFEN
ncbi:PQQ-dependent sugar dehydrogenase [Haloferula sp. BvORR071]|uniref:PQQ-dependent sugar dehydrogenase n=1 Tax=Haloferula sp. BvORR071 TaxID=1396141 RepID=UPI00054D8C00|nr:PQQ-dependent sugar dehydrogenase [Haloferula sp. BvORR071]